MLAARNRRRVERPLGAVEMVTGPYVSSSLKTKRIKAFLPEQVEIFLITKIDVGNIVRYGFGKQTHCCHRRRAWWDGIYEFGDLCGFGQHSNIRSGSRVHRSGTLRKAAGVGSYC